MKIPLTSLVILSLSAAMAYGGEQPKAMAPAPVSPTASAQPETAVVPTTTSVAPPSARPKFSTAELEKLAAPIALYPDPVLASVLAASVYPVEIVQAARFVKDTNNVARVDQQPWDSNVKAVAKMPSVIAKMDADLEWTVRLGQAFLEQPMDLMDAMQGLRTKAQAAGALKTTAQQVVTVTNSVVERTYENQVVYVTNTVIQVQPASAQVVYVPTYNPSTVYVEKDDDDAAAAAVVSFGVGMMFGAAMWGHCDWHYGGCYWGGYPPPPPPRPPPYYPPPGSRPPPPAGRPPGSQPPGNRPPGSQPPGDRPTGGQRPGSGGPTASTQPAQRWQPDQNRLASSGAGSSATREARGWGGASTQPGVSARPATGTSGARPAAGNVAARPSAVTKPSPAASTYSRPSASSSYSRPSTSASGGGGNSAFSGVSSGSNTRSYSNRGSTSRSGGFSGGGGSGGRGGGGRGGRGR